MDTILSADSLKSGRRRRTYTAQFKADMVAQCLQGDVSLASLAVDHGMNPNVLHRWVLEHERYGKHSLPGDGEGALVAQPRDMSPANWIPLSASPGTTDRPVVAKAPDKIIDALAPSTDADPQARSTIALELAAQGLRMTLRWPGEDRRGLAGFVRELLT